MFKAYGKMWGNYGDVKGRATRFDFWWGIFVHIVVSYLLNVVATCLVISLAGSQDGLLVGLILLIAYYIFFCLTPSACLCIRRLHDAGYSGWYLLLGLVPFLGLIALLVLYCLPSEPKSNKFGAYPYAKRKRKRKK